MWLVEKRAVILPDKFDRGLIKDEINRILNGLSVVLPDNGTISFTEKDAVFDGVSIGTKSGPNRTYLESNPFEVCICICDKDKPNSPTSIESKTVINIAKEMKDKIGVLKAEDFRSTCNNINDLLDRHGYKLMILYVEGKWVVSNKKSEKMNYTTIISNLSDIKKEEKGCCVLYGI